MSNENNVKRARDIIESNNFMSLATCTSSGNPWATPLFYAYDDKYNLYFVSSKNSLHVNHIMDNPTVAVTIFNSTQPAGSTEGVQLLGQAEWVKDEEELGRAIDLYYRRLLPEVRGAMTDRYPTATYLPPSRFRFFKISIRRAYIPDVRGRVEIKLGRR